MTLIFAQPTLASDPRTAARDASAEAIDSHEAALLAIELTELAIQECKKSFSKYPANAKFLAEKSGLLTLCNSLDDDIAKFRKDLGSPVDTSALDGPTIIKWIDYYNSMVDYANQLAESMDAITVGIEDMDNAFIALAQMKELADKLTVYVGMEIEDLIRGIQKWPIFVKSSVEKSLGYRNLQTYKSSVQIGSQRVDEVIQYLPQVKSFKTLQEELNRMRQIVKNLPNIQEIQTAVDVAKKAAPTFVCQKGSKFMAVSSSDKCKKGYTRVVVKL